MPKHVVVVRASPRIYQEQSIVVCHPMLLGVVVAEVAVVIKLPFTLRLEIQTIVADADITMIVVTHRQVEFALKPG